MPVFANCIAADQDRPSETGVFVRGETIQAAVALVCHPEVNLYPLPADAVWPGDRGAQGFPSARKVGKTQLQIMPSRECQAG